MVGRFVQGLILSLPIFHAPVCKSQTIDTSFQIFWFKGQKINDTSLRRVGGDVIRFSPSSGAVTVNFSPANDRFGTIKTEIAKVEQMKVGVDDGLSGAQRNAGLIVQVNRGIDAAANEMKVYLDDRYQVTDPTPPPVSSTSDLPGIITYTYAIPDEVIKAYEEVKSLVANMDAKFEVNTVVPPNTFYDYCLPCDAARKTKYDKDTADFYRVLFASENIVSEKTGTVLGYFQKLRSAKKPYFDSVRSTAMSLEMVHAKMIMAERQEKKVLFIWNSYKAQPEKVPFLIEMLLRNIRSRQLIGMPDLPDFPTTNHLAAVQLMAIKRVLDEAKAAHDYKVLLNIPMISNFIARAQMLGLNDNGWTELLNSYLQLNRFKITVNAEANLNHGGGQSEMGRLKYEGEYEAYPDPNDPKCALRWLPSPNREAKGMVYDLEKIDLKMPKKNPVYVGTHQFGSRIPSLKLDFCVKERDTALFYPFFAFNGNETWELDKMPAMNLQVVNIVFMMGFMDMEAAKQKAADVNNPIEKGRLLKEMSFWKDRVEAMGKLVNGLDPKFMPGKYYEAAAQMVDAQDIMEQVVMSTTTYKFILKKALTNFDKTVFNEVVDGKQKYKYPLTEYATFKVKIEHIE